jgi:glycoside/pentoside/hexuronide:cation symporter, GPH family
VSEAEHKSALFQRAHRRQGRVPLRIKLFHGLGALPGQHKDWTFSTLLLLFYSQVHGLPASFAAVVLAVSLVIDAVSDPLVGAYSDNFKSVKGRRHPLMLAAIVPTACCMYALFIPPQDLGTFWLGGWMLVFTILTRVAFTFFAVPWHAITAELSEDYAERTSIITYWMMVGWTGGVIFIFAMYSAVFPSSEAYSNGLLNPASYSLFAGVFALLAATWMTLTTWLTRKQSMYLPQPTAATPAQSLTDMLRRTGLALQSRNFRLLFFAVLIGSAVTGTGQVFDVYMNVYYWEFPTEDIRWFSIAVIGAIGSFVTAGLLQVRFQKQNIMITAFAMVALLAMLKVLFRFWDIWPDNGDPLLVWLFVGHAVVMAYFGSMVLIMFASMVADLVDEQEYLTGLRQEGVFSAGITFAAKATTGLGLIMGGLLLDTFIAFPKTAAPGEVDADTLFLLAFSDGIAVPALNLIPFLLLLRYTLTRSRLTEIQQELRNRAQAQ